MTFAEGILTPTHISCAALGKIIKTNSLTLKSPICKMDPRKQILILRIVCRRFVGQSFWENNTSVRGEEDKIEQRRTAELL